jgi:hypothetical protein
MTGARVEIMRITQWCTMIQGLDAPKAKFKATKLVGRAKARRSMITQLSA